MRSALVAAPHVKLRHLRRLDDRLAAQLDGVRVAGTAGATMCEAALETPGVGQVFVVAVRAIEAKDASALERHLALAETEPQAERGLTSAFGWVSAQQLEGTVNALIASSHSFRMRIGIAACASHGVDPGPVLEFALKSQDPALRARAVRSASELGRVDLLPHARSALADEDEDVRFRAACAAALLGDHQASLRSLEMIGRGSARCSATALHLLLQAADLDRGHAILGDLVSGAEHPPMKKRVLVRCCGAIGDPRYVPWLIGLMADDSLARCAGESLSFVTGADLAELDLERKPPEGIETGPNDNPDDDNVAMDEDDGLPWPDQAKVDAWWSANAHRFTPGTRYFVGAPPTWEHCVHVVKEGYQRQRIVAAQYLCLLRPGTVLFNCAAPAWRQQRLLAKLQ
jgi:uncharacterized protein (TIGR02270 family)